MIKSAVTDFAVCPTWFLGPDSGPPWEERVALDAALVPAQRDSIRTERTRLTETLANVRAQIPGDNWITGQLVRLLVDQQDFPAAARVAESCGAAPSWCAMLHGYIAYVRGDWAIADSNFAIAAHRLEARPRCSWENVSLLLEPETRTAYEKLPCGVQDTLNRRFWWLATPLWAASVNQRRVEQQARQVLVLLRSALPRDERFSWQRQFGNDARQEMVLRYGWPSFSFWRGLAEDESHTRELVTSISDKGALPSPANEPYATYEYSRGRTHTAPSSRAFLNPLAATARDWSLNAPPGGDTVPWPPVRPALPITVTPGLMGRIAAEHGEATRQWEDGAYRRYVRETLWWPVEHYAAPYRLVQLSDPETAFLRRQLSCIIATALTIDPKAIRLAAGDTLEGATLVATNAPDSIRRIERVNAVAGRPLVLQGEIAAKPTLIGVEVLPAEHHDAARTRYAVTPPPALAALTQGAIDVSMPVLLRARNANEELPVNTRDALNLMSPTSEFRRGALGVYWETYGVSPSDSAELAIWVERYTPQSGLRRLGQRLRIASDLNTPIVIRWSEATARPNAMIIRGPVPVVGRSVVLDTSKLPAGEYWLGVAVQIRGREPVQSRRSITIR